MGRRYYSFGSYKLDPIARTLLRDEKVVSLTPKAVETLHALVRCPGEIVSKEALLEQVWPGVFVEEGGLTRNICDLRRALSGFDGASPIQTVPKRGYRFAAPVIEQEFSRTRQKVLALLPISSIDVLEDPTLLLRLQEALAARLAMLQALRVEVVSGGNGDARWDAGSRDAGELSKPDYVLSGTFQHQNGTLRMAVRLVEAGPQKTLWAETFDRLTSDLFALQDSLAEEIAGAVGLLLSAEQPKMLSRRYTESSLAYQFYLQGRFHWSQRSEQHLRRAIQCFRRALAEDAEFAPAYSALSSSYSLLPMLSTLRSHDLMPQARAAAVSALQIDETLAEARAALAFVKWHYEWNWDEAEREYRRIIKYQPEHAMAHQWLGLLLAERGRMQEGVKQARMAREIDDSAHIQANLACVLYFAGRPSEAMEHAREVLEGSPRNIRAALILGLSLQQMGRMGEAVRRLEEAHGWSPGGPLVTGALGYAYAACGEEAKAKQLEGAARSLRGGRSDYYTQAMVRAGLGDAQQAIVLLEQACGERAFELVVLGADRRLDALRHLAGFPSVLARIHLAE